MWRGGQVESTQTLKMGERGPSTVLIRCLVQSDSHRRSEYLAWSKVWASSSSPPAAADAEEEYGTRAADAEEDPAGEDGELGECWKEEEDEEWW